MAQSGAEGWQSTWFLFRLTGETMKRFVAKPSDRAAVVRELAESGGGSLESYYWMLGQYDGVGVFELPDSRTMAALSLAASSSGAFAHFETPASLAVVTATVVAECSLWHRTDAEPTG
jgi:uncharacterized protein with GYD domain